MAKDLSRREFLVRSAAVAAAATAAGTRGRSTAAPATSAPADDVGKLPVSKALLWDMLPAKMSTEDRFALARDLGFDGVEAPTNRDPANVAAMRAAADKVGLRIHSVMNMAHWSHPLSSADPSVVRQSVEGVRLSLKNAKAFGADTVLIVPAVVDAKTRYVEAYERSTKVVRGLIEPAAEVGVVLAIEEVWNRFLLSPIEFAAYVDQFGSKYVRAYFDVGNIMAYGFPQDWIRTLGSRIVKVHLKDFDVAQHKFVPLLEGSVDWREVRRALHEIGYKGYVTAELPAGDEAYLRHVSTRMDRIIQGDV